MKQNNSVFLLILFIKNVSYVLKKQKQYLYKYF